MNCSLVPSLLATHTASEGSCGARLGMGLILQCVSGQNAVSMTLLLLLPQLYLHPSRIPHSPQRFENTVGLVRQQVLSYTH